MAGLMKIDDETLEKIGKYVKKNLPTWSRELSLVQNDLGFQKTTTVLERELVHQRELMQVGFQNMSKRFEQTDKRFEEQSKQFNIRFDESKEYFRGLHNFMRWQFGVSTIFLSGIMIKLLMS